MLYTDGHHHFLNTFKHVSPSVRCLPYFFACIGNADRNSCDSLMKFSKLICFDPKKETIESRLRFFFHMTNYSEDTP